METILFFEISPSFLLFKSYYVVWKLSELEVTKDEYEGFKSYYVVWKLPLTIASFTSVSGLNRTM